MITLDNSEDIYFSRDDKQNSHTAAPLHISRNVHSFRYTSYIGIFTGCVGKDFGHRGCLTKKKKREHLTLENGIHKAAVGGR